MAITCVGCDYFEWLDESHQEWSCGAGYTSPDDCPYSNREDAELDYDSLGDDWRNLPEDYEFLPYIGNGE